MTLIAVLARLQSALAAAAAAVVARSPRASRELPALRSFRRIVVVRLDEIGDAVLSTAFLRELRLAAPDAQITLVAQPSVVGLLAATPHVDRLISYDIRCSRTLRPFILPLRALAFGVRRLRPLRADLVILPRWDADQCYATMVARFSAARYRVGYSHNVREYKARINAGFDRLLTHALDERGVTHEVERSLALLRWMGADPGDAAPELTWSSEASTAADALLPPGSMTSELPWVALCPSFGHSVLKQWPTEHLVALARRLDARGDVRIVIVGSAADRELAAPIVRELQGRALDLTGATTLSELPALLSRCALFIGADTGVMHIAAAVGTPVIGLLGPTNVGRFAPWRQEFVSLDMPCSPIHRLPEADRCPTCILGSPRCMIDMTPGLVYGAVARQLDAREGVPAPGADGAGLTTGTQEAR